MKTATSQRENEYLSRIYTINPQLTYQIVDERVVITKEQNHWVQRFFRKLYVRIPKQTTVMLDTYGSAVFQAIDGKVTVETLGRELEGQYDEAGTHLYERLILYLHHLEVEEKWIQLV